MFTGSPSTVAWGAAFTLLLLVACVIDLRVRRIPNALVLAILGGGLLFAATTGELGPAIVRSLLGVAVGFGIWIAFHVVGVIGAGDVKFFSAIGAWLGPALTWRAALLAALAGGVLAVVFLVRQRRLRGVLQGFALAGATRSADILGAALPRDGRGAGLPYGVALAVGALVVAWLPQVF